MKNEMDANDQLACAGVTLQFFAALDGREHARAAALMAPDGSWDRQGQLLSGRDAVLDALEQRPKERATCHLVSNLWVEPLAAERARVHFYLTAYEGMVTGDGIPVARPLGMRSGTDDMVRLPEGWRIEAKRSRPILRGA